MFSDHDGIHQLAAALTECTDLSVPSDARDRLWLALQGTVCTKGRVHIRPYGAREAVEVTEEHSDLELITAYTYLRDHEQELRKLPCHDLAFKLRAVATKHGGGSARAAQSDSMCGVTKVGRGDSIMFVRREYDQWAEIA